MSGRSMWALLSLAAAFTVGCNNFEALVARCEAEGRCGAAATGGGGGGGVASLPPALVVSPGTLAFTLVAGDTVAAKQVTVTNLDGGVAAALTPSLTSQTDFELDNTCGQTLDVGASCTVSVKFVPKDLAAGVRTTTLDVRASTGNPTSVAMTGTVTAALELPPQVDFGDATIGEQVTAELSARNLSSRPVTLEVDPLSLPFGVVRNDCNGVGAGQACLVQLRFVPATLGLFQTQLKLKVSGSTASQTVTLQGRGVQPGVISITPAQVFAGDLVDVGQSSDHVFTVQNNGSQTVGPVTLSLGADGGFSIVDAGCGLLAAGATCSGVLRFTAASFGTWAATLRADAGPAGGASSNSTANARGRFTLTLGINDREPGISLVARFPDGGVLDCPGSCSAQVAVDPRAVPSIVVDHVGETWLRRFEAWAVDCSGTGGCSVQMDRDHAVTELVGANAPIVFATSQGFSGNLGGLAGADGLCRAFARDAGLPGNYLALLGTSSPDSGVGRLDAGLVYFSPTAEVMLVTPAANLRNWTDERGAPVSISVWTGMTIAGAPSSTTCGDWACGSNCNNVQGLYDTSYAGSVSWNSSSTWCSSQYAIVCANTASGTPRASPDAGVLMYVATGALDRDGGLQSADSACAAIATRFGFPATRALAYLGSATGSAATRVSNRPELLDAGWRLPLVRLDGVGLGAPANAVILGSGGNTPAHGIGLTIDPSGAVVAAPGTVINGGVSSPTVTASPSVTTNCQGYTVITNSGSTYLGDALTPSLWWWSGTGAACSATNTYSFYCVAFP